MIDPSSSPDTHIILNGITMPTAQAAIPVDDRSFLYGDGLFETIRVYQGRPVRLTQHLQRLLNGMDFLGISLKSSTQEIQGWCLSLIEKNGLAEGGLRLHVSRGSGPRGLKTGPCNQPLVLIQTFSATAPIRSAPMTYRVQTARTIRIPLSNPLLHHKTANRLLWILAMREAEQTGSDDALLLNTEGEVTECSAGNLFWFEKDNLVSPSLETGALPGITRQWILEIASELGMATMESRVQRPHLNGIEGLFMTLSTRGMIQITHLDGETVPPHPCVNTLWKAYLNALKMS